MKTTKKYWIFMLIYPCLMSATIIQPMNVTKSKMHVTVSAMDVIVYPILGDVDGDGVPNSRDPFPNNPNEWQDTDHDGIGNNADKDDDNDGIPDSAERANHLNPLNASDASGDLDRDGFTNLMEYQLGTNMRSASSHPTWTPIIMGDLMMFIPVK